MIKPRYTETTTHRNTLLSSGYIADGYREVVSTAGEGRFVYFMTEAAAKKLKVDRIKSAVRSTEREELIGVNYQILNAIDTKIEEEGLMRIELDSLHFLVCQSREDPLPDEDELLKKYGLDFIDLLLEKMDEAQDASKVSLLANYRKK